MKTFFVANKHSYGSGFDNICDSLDELKQAIIKHEHMFEDEQFEYSEELFNKCSKHYTLIRVELHPNEEIQFGEYDGTSWFTIVSKTILSTFKEIEK